MANLMLDIYPWVKSFHIMAVIAWMAGLFYLPRLFVHHVEQAAVGSEMSETFKMMEMKLLRVIMNPAMIVAWVLGLTMIATPGVVAMSDGWLHVKLLGVVAMTVFHMWLARQRRLLEADGTRLAGRTYRIANEVPTVLMVIIVIMVVVKPF
ncbi:MAG: protoporphyrinogen oxidase HemJ [Pseudomonadota bacterium]